MPSPAASFFLICALTTTFTAAITGLLNLTRGQLTRIEAARAKRDLVVFGDTPEAAAIVDSLSDDERNRLIRIGEESDSKTGPFSLVLSHSIHDDAALTRIVSNAAEVFIAGGDDGTNARLRREINAKNDECIQYQLVKSPVVAKALYPGCLEKIPQDRVIHVNDQVGQIVARLLSACANKHKNGITVSITACGQDPLSENVVGWVKRMAIARQYLNPSKPITIDREDSEPDLRVIVGDGEAVLAELAGSVRVTPTIATVAYDLLHLVDLPANRRIHRFSREAAVEQLSAGETVAIDPLADALKVAEVRQGISTQWGMAFDEAYRALFKPASVRNPWNPYGKNEQSSIQAAEFMLTNLKNFGYLMVKGESGWVCGRPKHKTLLEMAKAEHEDWLRRRWKSKEGVSRPVTLKCSNGKWVKGPNAGAFNELPEEARNYNLQVISTVYPGLAAIFGYGIAPIDQFKNTNPTPE